MGAEATARRAKSASNGASPVAGRNRVLEAISGLVVVAVALGVGQIAVGFVGETASPVFAIGQAAIDGSPEWLRSFAIRNFGANDKRVLVAGILVVLAIGSMLIGIVASRRPWVGYLGLVVLGGIGAIAALSRPAARLSWAVPSLVATAAGAGAFALIRSIGYRGREFRDHAASTGREPAGFDRRRFLRASLALTALAAAGDRLGAFVNDRRLATASRASVRIPTAASTAGQLPRADELRVPGLSPFFTSDDEFYRVDTTIFVPHVRAETWKLRIHGMVDRELEIGFNELLARPMIERDITLNCVSNPVGGRYVGNARWIGTPLKPLLDEAGVHTGADQIVGRSVDGMTIGTPTAVALDGRDSMLAVAMNGQPLPFEHGFPVRMIVPGLYGYESATKWIVDMELTTLAAYDAYWVRRGWAQVAQIKTQSRIDTPHNGAHLSQGMVPIAGVAWAQHRGISRVDVRVDGGPWNEASLSAQDTVDTWRQWVWRWSATAGDHLLEARATDGTGAVQTEIPAPLFPNGASGLHRIVVSVG